MTIVVTSGETALISAFQKADVEITIENLLVGDIHIRKDGQTVYIFERKAKGDLDASIKDGRYHEQKGRMLETGLPRKNIVYIIEQLTRPRVTAYKRVWSAMCNSHNRDEFTVILTKDTTDTVEYLTGMSALVNHIEDSDTPRPKVNEVNINIKKRQVALEEWFTYSLTLVPKCSLSIAKVITGKYPNMSSLISAIENDGMECLANFKHGDSQRRIGNKLSNEICEVVLNNY
uniref:ERCC4 domain-containing protein EP364R n=1 Tax=Marseillevirus LCMAC201 TaxID=2506605 RepID=A0A481YWB7_9VIRU|nr:MAG: ERCC4 domain protein [Marseillevirus LCMAC201]